MGVQATETRPTTDKRVHFRHAIERDPLFPHRKKYTFTATGRDAGSYTREIHAMTLAVARDKLREDFPGAVF